MSDAPTGVTYLTSLSLPPNLQVTRMDMSDQASLKGVPTGSNFINRSAAIPVMVQSREGHLLDFMPARTSIQAVAIPDQVEVAANTTYAERTAPSDPGTFKPEIEISIDGSTTAQGSPKSMFAGAEVMQMPNNVVGQSIEQRRKSMYRPDEKPVEPPKVEKIAQPTQVEEPKPVMQVVKPKVRVKLSNKNIGRVTVSVVEVAVSETCVILAYDKDAENIYEPPTCDSEMPLIVEFGDKKYTCVFGGWTAEVAGLFQVIMLLDDGSTTST